MNKQRVFFWSGIVVFIIALVVIVLSVFYKSNANLHILGEDVPTILAIKNESNSLRQTHQVNYDVQFDLHVYEEMNRLANLDFASKSGVYDIILQYNTALANYVNKGYVLPFEELRRITTTKDTAVNLDFQNNLFQKCWKEIGWYSSDRNANGEPFGIPFSANTMVLVYNKNLFEQYKDDYKNKFKKTLVPPSTWDDFLSIAEYFEQPQKNIHGLALQGASYFIYHEWTNLAFSYGGGVMKKKWGWEGSDTTELILSSSQTIEATKKYLKLSKYNGSKDYLSTDPLKQVTYLHQGNIAMGLIWTDVAYALSYPNDTLDDRFAYVPIPGKVSMLAGGSYYINKNSKHIPEAVNLILNFMKPKNQINMMKHGLCSPLRTIYDDPEIKAIPYSIALQQSLDRGVYMLEAGPDADLIITIISDALQEIWRRQDFNMVEPILKKTELQIRDKRNEMFQYLLKEKTDK